MRIRRAVLEELLSHARRDAPLEACGLLAGNAGAITLYVPCENTEASALSYAIAPIETLRALRLFDARGLAFVGVFHSHPAGEATPSLTDIAQAQDPELLHLIAAPRSTRPLRAFKITGENALEEPLELT